MTIFHISEPRTVRLFVSSTFRDMEDERNELVKHIFPELRRRCRERGVEFTDVDLRWGIKNQREVLPLCLAEIERCRPYFICHLGNRYGWIPETIDNELIEEHPWLESERGKSVTELEVIHGVLNNPNMTQRAFFYFRDPARSDEIEQQLAKELDYQPEPPKSKAKLKNLKDTIRDSDFLVTEDYPDIKTFGKRVLEELWAAIDKEYPEGSQPTRLEQEWRDHEVFAAARRKTYIGREHYFTLLDEHTDDDGLPLVLLGESGSGKSSLIANWVARYRQRRPDDFILTRFIGGTPDSADYLLLLRGIMEEIEARYAQEGEREEKGSHVHGHSGEDEAIPTESGEIRRAFPIWLAKAAARETNEGRRFVLILDALNQLNDRDNAPYLGWLPEQITPSVRLILSTLPGPSLTTLEERGWPTLEIARLDEDERERFITHYLARFGKALNPTRISRVARAQQSANPLFLRTLLEELRLFGSHEKLDERIDHYLEAQDTVTLFTKVLERYEEDYDRHRPNLTRETMSLLWAARRGLSETELLKLLGSDDQPLPQADWSPLHLATEEFLLNRAGLLNFSHDFMRQAVAMKYLSTEAEKQQFHQRLAGHFQSQSLSWRKIQELPWQLNEAKAWQDLYDCLADLPFFQAAYQNNPFEVLNYWLRIESHSPLNRIDAYKNVLKTPEKFIDYLSTLCQLFKEKILLDEALILGKARIEHHRAINNLNQLKAALNDQGTTFFRLKNLSEAMKLFEESEEVCRNTDDAKTLITPLGNRADVFYAQGNLEKALDLNKEIENICTDTENISGLVDSICEQANILHELKKNDCATTLLNKAENICTKHNYQYGLIKCLSIQATILAKKKDIKGAFFILKRQEKICRNLGALDKLKLTLGQKHEIFFKESYFHQAEDTAHELAKICIETGDAVILHQALHKITIHRVITGEIKQALKSYKHMLKILDIPPSKRQRLALFILRVISIVVKIRPHVLISATVILVFASITISPWIWIISIPLTISSILLLLLKAIKSLCFYMELLCDLGDFNHRGRGSDIETGNENPINLQKQASQLEKRYELSGAMTLHQEHERIARKENDLAGIQASLGKQALILIDRELYDNALDLLREQESICLNIDNPEGLQTSLGNQALVFSEKEELERSMTLLKKQESICRESDIKHGLAKSLYNQSIISEKIRNNSLHTTSHKEQGEQIKRSAALIEEAHQIAKENEFHSLEKNILFQIHYLKGVQSGHIQERPIKALSFASTIALIFASINVSPWFWLLGIPAIGLSSLFLLSYIYRKKTQAQKNK